MKVFVSGSRSVSLLPEGARASLARIVELGYTVLVGDCYGVDAAVQRWLAEHGYTNVVVYHVGKVRNNAGFETKRVAGGYVDKDIAMSKACDYGMVVWDGHSKGTLSNVRRLKHLGKAVKSYLL